MWEDTCVCFLQISKAEWPLAVSRDAISRVGNNDVLPVSHR
ncbi:MAG: hypothetical protein ACI80S_000444 [Pseudohongiellaceae bacterium]|jgi:hypothetical protein